LTASCVFRVVIENYYNYTLSSKTLPPNLAFCSSMDPKTNENDTHASYNQNFGESWKNHTNFSLLPATVKLWAHKLLDALRIHCLPLLLQKFAAEFAPNRITAFGLCTFQHLEEVDLLSMVVEDCSLPADSKEGAKLQRCATAAQPALTLLKQALRRFPCLMQRKLKHFMV
jgi:hypothetical protein